MHLSSASYAYPRLDGASRAVVVERLADAAPIAGVFMLSTCLRVELAVAGEVDRLEAAVSSLVGPLPVTPEIRTGQAAATHLFRVGAGLESPIVGELEVLTQFRTALAALAPPVEGGFRKLLETAVATGREARTMFESSPHDTMAALAAQVVGGAPEVAVLGSGTMATAVADALAGLPAPPRVVVLARSPERVELAGREVWSLARLSEVLRRFPALVSATAAASRLLDSAEMAAAIGGRERRLTLVDMAMPPDFGPEDDGVDYIDIDGLAEMAARRVATSVAVESVEAAARAAHHRYAGNGRVGPIIAEMFASGDAVVEETVERFAGRLTHPGDRDVLRQAAHTVARTLLARPVEVLRSSTDETVTEAISTSFRS